MHVLYLRFCYWYSVRNLCSSQERKRHRYRCYGTLYRRCICTGILAKNAAGDILKLHAKDTVLATGGIGGLYKHSTNFPSLTGDGLDVAKKHGVRLEHLDYVQIHPTSCTARSRDAAPDFRIDPAARGQFC